jgi:hypothetical protein
MTPSADAPSIDPAELLAAVDDLAASGRVLDALERLRAESPGTDDVAVLRRLVELSYAGFGELDETGFDQWPAPAADVDRSGPPRLPEISPADLNAEVVRTNIQSWGGLLVRGLFRGHVQPFVDGIESSLSIRTTPEADERESTPWFRSLPLPGPQAQSLGRLWVAGAGGILACDSPKLLDMIFRSYTEVGLREVITDYLGERPVLSANKCTLRRVPLSTNTDWHQDGAFLGDGIRALNVWIALSDCGVDSPGLDVVPRRFDEVVETGTGGAIFDWAVGSDTVARLAPEAPPVRPVFQAGDAMLFDDLYLHRSAIEPTMTRPRYAIESWFFASSTYPDGQVPLVW